MKFVEAKRLNVKSFLLIALSMTTIMLPILFPRWVQIISAQVNCAYGYGYAYGYSPTTEAIAVQAGDESTDFKMISFTRWWEDGEYVNAEDALSASLGGMYDPDIHRIATYDPVLGDYLELDEDIQIQPGLAYWVFLMKDTEIQYTGEPVGTDYDMRIKLKYNEETGDGWNMIGSPNRDYYWNDVMVVVYEDYDNCEILFGPARIGDLQENPYISTDLYRWENGKYQSDTQTVLKNEGYWIEVRHKGVHLVFPDEAPYPYPYERKQKDDTIACLDIGKAVLAKIAAPRSAFADSYGGPPSPPMLPGEKGSDGGTGCFINSLAGR